MFDIRQELLTVVRALEGSEVPYALCGGLAVALHGFPRATKDIDLLVLPEDLEAVRVALRPGGYVLEAAPMTFQVGKPEEQRIHRGSRVDDGEIITVDLLLVGPFLADVWATREAFAVNGVRIVAASRVGLVKIKRSAGRPQDLADVERLEANGPI